MLALTHAVPWVHIIPAILAVVFGFFYLKTKWVYLKVCWGFLWLLFLPNTAYIFIDLERLALHWNSISTVMRLALLLQYICLEIIGLILFLLAMLPFESIIRTKHLSQKAQLLAIILLNFFIGFGMVLGRTGYTNSWVIFTQLTKVFLAAINIFTSFNLLGLTIIFGILCNFIYFLFRNLLVQYAKKFIENNRL